METIKVYRADELEKHTHIKLIKTIAKSRTRSEREFASLKIDIRYFGKNQFCILGRDWYLYYRTFTDKTIEIEMLEAMNDTARVRERTIEIIASLKELLLAYPNYFFEVYLNHKSRAIYNLALKFGIIAESWSSWDDSRYFNFARFYPSPKFIEQNNGRDKKLDFKRLQFH